MFCAGWSHGTDPVLPARFGVQLVSTVMPNGNASKKSQKGAASEHTRLPCLWC